MNNQTIALTGATGFIGRHVLRALSARGYRIRVLLRRPTELPANAAGAVVGDLSRPQNMSMALAGIDAVIHTAGLSAHMSGAPQDDHRALDTEATIGLARAAERAGVRRFVFLSALRAQCGPTAGEVLTEERAPAPTDAYGRSKLAAEQGLAALGLDWVALRLALVYGPGVSGNMARLMAVARSPWPLPLAGLTARRSLLALDNLVAAVECVLASGQPLRRPLIVADREALTVADMIAAMRRGLGRRPGLVPMPVAVLRRAFEAVGQSDAFLRVASPLVADPSALASLGWAPPVATPDGLERLMREAPGESGPGSG
jgi:nucleoside-diphosphate-sugar epimerase